MLIEEGVICFQKKERCDIGAARLPPSLDNLPFISYRHCTSFIGHSDRSPNAKTVTRHPCGPVEPPHTNVAQPPSVDDATLAAAGAVVAPVSAAIWAFSAAISWSFAPICC